VRRNQARIDERPDGKFDMFVLPAGGLPRIDKAPMTADEIVDYLEAAPLTDFREFSVAGEECDLPVLHAVARARNRSFPLVGPCPECGYTNQANPECPKCGAACT
jgi:hypothetical protein